jgi:hypothetical protein
MNRLSKKPPTPVRDCMLSSCDSTRGPLFRSTSVEYICSLPEFSATRPPSSIEPCTL